MQRKDLNAAASAAAANTLNTVYIVASFPSGGRESMSTMPVDESCFVERVAAIAALRGSYKGD
ncbi:hypothetical protein MTX20_08760 [Bradyrhizobium sp. ISRA435]|nr:hypothetical protein MTX20_08760 [Bradyrhizobium sp. ISRA435]